MAENVVVAFCFSVSTFILTNCTEQAKVCNVVNKHIAQIMSYERFLCCKFISNEFRDTKRPFTGE